MLTGRSVRVLAVVTAAALGCGDNDGTGPSPNALVGNWRATKCEFVSVANSSRVDLVPNGGTIRLALAQGGTYVLTVSQPGEPDEVTSGAWSASKDVLTLKRGIGEWQFDMSLAGGTLTLSGADTDFDFDGDDVDEPAVMNLIMVRE